MKSVLRWRHFLLGSMVLYSSVARADYGFPVVYVMDRLVELLTGKIAYDLAVIAFVACGLVLAFGDLQGGLKRIIQICCGFSFAFSAKPAIIYIFHKFSA